MSYEAWRISFQSSEEAARAAYEECARLHASRSMEGDRLDWLMVKLPGKVTRELIGEMADTRDPEEWRALIDKAMKTPNVERNRPGGGLPPEGPVDGSVMPRGMGEKA